MFGRPQWLTPAGRSRQYVQEICRRIGDDKIELGNACRRVVARDPKAAAGQSEEEGETPAEVLVEAAEAVEGGSEGSGEISDGVKVKKEEDSGRWEVVDGKGNTRYFDEVRTEWGGRQGGGREGGRRKVLSVFPLKMFVEFFISMGARVSCVKEWSDGRFPFWFLAGADGCLLR